MLPMCCGRMRTPQRTRCCTPQRNASTCVRVASCWRCYTSYTGAALSGALGCTLVGAALEDESRLDAPAHLRNVDIASHVCCAFHQAHVSTPAGAP
jgi:hypothetical protein